MMNNELLSIESAFLNLPAVKTALNLADIKRANRDITNAQKKKFDHTIKMAKLVTTAVDFYESEEGKELFAEEGIEWSKADLGLKVFGWQKSFFYKVVKAGLLDERIVESYRVKTDANTDASRSLAGLLTFASTIDLSTIEHDIDATEQEIELAEIEAIEEAELETEQEAIATIFTMSYKSANGNVAVRIDENNEVTTRNDRQEIQSAIEFLNNLILI
jgi:hypothetical protein